MSTHDLYLLNKKLTCEAERLSDIFRQVRSAAPKLSPRQVLRRIQAQAQGDRGLQNILWDLGYDRPIIDTRRLHQTESWPALYPFPNKDGGITYYMGVPAGAYKPFECRQVQEDNLKFVCDLLFHGGDFPEHSIVIPESTVRIKRAP